MKLITCAVSEYSDQSEGSHSRLLQVASEELVRMYKYGSHSA